MKEDYAWIMRSELRDPVSCEHLFDGDLRSVLQDQAIKRSHLKPGSSSEHRTRIILQSLDTFSF